LDEFVVQKTLSCHVTYEGDRAAEAFVELSVWDEWMREIVEYFVERGHSGSEIDAFVQEHGDAARR
jgi:hypothetical protein